MMDIREFWTTFSKSIKEHLIESKSAYIAYITSIFPSLTRDRQIDLVDNFITNNVEELGYNMIIKDSFQSASYLNTNMKRWTRISNRNPLNGTDFSYIFKIYISSIFKNTYKNITIINLLKNYVTGLKNNDSANILLLKDIANIAIDNMMVSVIDNLRNLLDINKFLKDDVKIHPEISSKKLIFLLKRV